MTPAEVVQAQLDAYNAQDVDALCAFYTHDCVLAGFNGEITSCGRDSLRERHVKLFAQFPQNHARLVHRAVAGGYVVDHEHVTRAPGGEDFEVVVVYAFRDGLIARSDFIR